MSSYIYCGKCGGGWDDSVPGTVHDCRTVLANRNAISTNGGLKFDTEKPMMDLLDPKAMKEMAKVLTFGAKKYGKYNWKKGLTSTRTTAAALRHIFAFLDGEDMDADSGCHHLGCAMVELMFTLHFCFTRKDLDDRFREEIK